MFISSVYYGSLAFAINVVARAVTHQRVAHTRMVDRYVGHWARGEQKRPIETNSRSNTSNSYKSNKDNHQMYSVWI